MFVSAGQKKKRRKSRWSAGIYAKKKASYSPHASRDDAHLVSDEEEEDGEDEEEVEKGGGTEEDEGSREREHQMVVDVETKQTTDSQTQHNKENTDKSVTEQQSKEDKVTDKGNENSETISVNVNQESHAEMEEETEDPSNTEKGDKSKSCELTETENRVVTVGEAEHNSPTEPVEVDATQTSSDTSGTVKEDRGTGWMFLLSDSSLFL